MTIRLPDSFELGYWTEFEGVALDDIIDGTSVSVVTSSYVYGDFSDPVMSSQKIRVSSRSFGYITTSGSLRTTFEEDVKRHVFRHSNFQRVINGQNRGQMQNRYRQVFEDMAFSNDQQKLGKPLILDTLVPQAPDVVLALSSKLTSNWSLPKIQLEPNLYKFSGYFQNFQLNHFHLNPPFAYNHTDLFANHIAGKKAFPNDSYVTYYDDAPPDGNHHGKGFVPYTTISYFTSNVLADSVYPTRNNYFSGSSVFVGLGHFYPNDNNTRLQDGPYPLPVSFSLPLLDVFSSSLQTYPLSGSRCFMFEKREQPNLCEEWLNVFPNEHRFKSLSRLYKNTRLGPNTWSSASNAAYSVQGWSIAPEYQYDDNGFVNDRTLGTLFWRFDKGLRVNKKPGFYESFMFDNNLPYLAYEYHNPYTWVETQYSPAIIMADTLGTTKTTYQEVTSGSITQSFVVMPKLSDILTDQNTRLQLSMSYANVFPKLEDINKAFYGFGDGIEALPSEYAYPDLGEGISNISHDGKYYWHRRRFIWGKGKVPSFERSYKFLHSMTLSLYPTPDYEYPVTFSYVSSSTVLNYGSEPGIWTDVSIPYVSYPNSETPRWFEGPVVVSGPILRGFKYGLFDANPRTAKCFFRKGHFGQLRDMLEQRLLFAYKTSEATDPIYVVRAKFVSGTNSDVTASNYRDWTPGQTEPFNKSDSGIYDDYCRVGKPFNDSGW